MLPHLFLIDLSTIIMDMLFVCAEGVAANVRTQTDVFSPGYGLSNPTFSDGFDFNLPFSSSCLSLQLEWNTSSVAQWPSCRINPSVNSGSSCLTRECLQCALVALLTVCTHKSVIHDTVLSSWSGASSPLFHPKVSLGHLLEGCLFFILYVPFPFFWTIEVWG
jgi:hypothetical protein